MGKYIGYFSQIVGIKEYQLIVGKDRGVRGVDFWTGIEFRFTVLSNRGLDISEAFFKGKSLCCRFSTGDVYPHFFEPEVLQWLSSFFGGDSLQPADLPILETPM